MYFIITIIQIQFEITEDVLNEDSLDSAVNWMTITDSLLYTVIDFISQLILLYRCWIMWGHPLVMAIPCILSLAFLVTALTTLGFQIKELTHNVTIPPPWSSSAVTAFFFLSLAVNTLVTALIVYRIITVYNDIRGHQQNREFAAESVDMAVVCSHM